jgi:hypothetical protein
VLDWRALNPEDRSCGDQQQFGYSPALRDARTAITRGAKAIAIRIREKPRSDTTLPISIIYLSQVIVYF